MSGNKKNCLRCAIPCLCIVLGFVSSITRAADGGRPTPHVFTMLQPGDVKLTGGVVAKAVDSGIRGRIASLPSARDGWYFKLYSKASKAENSTDKEARLGRNWQGEHVGKWMIAAARAASRTRSRKLAALVKEKANYLVSQQDPNGYLGTYIPSMRFYSDIRKDFSRTWDIWNSSYNILGFLEINKVWPDTKLAEAATLIGDLLYDTFYQTGKSVAYRGNHYGLSGVILIEPMVELYFLTGNQKYLNFAAEIVKQIEARPRLKLMKRTLAGEDIQSIGDGKIYQLLWVYTGIAKLYRATGNHDYLRATVNAWQCVADLHLTPTGGPWGGVGRNKETFNPGSFWSPYGIIETCSIMSWIHVNRELLTITGESKYADMLETVFLNALLGAQYFDGENWDYFTYVNGVRKTARHTACCRSSGMVALEEYAPLVFSRTRNGIAVNLYTPCEAKVSLADTNEVKITQETSYPCDGKVLIRLQPNEPSQFEISVRIPGWTESADITVNGQHHRTVTQAGTYVALRRLWRAGDEIVLRLTMPIQFHAKSLRKENGQRGLPRHWFAVTRGPLVYSTHGLPYGKKQPEPLRLRLDNFKNSIREVASPKGSDGPAIELHPRDREPILMLPYYQAGGIRPDGWRLTWLRYRKND